MTEDFSEKSKQHFSFGGFDGRDFLNTVHRLDTKTWCWSQVSPQNANGAPMSKYGCGMIAFRNSLVVLGEGGAPERGDPPEGGLATLPTTPPPLVGGSAREVSDLAVFLNVVGVGVGAQW